MTQVGHIMKAFVTVDINNIIKGVEECITIIKDLP